MGSSLSSFLTVVITLFNRGLCASGTSLVGGLPELRVLGIMRGPFGSVVILVVLVLVCTLVGTTWAFAVTLGEVFLLSGLAPPLDICRVLLLFHLLFDSELDKEPMAIFQIPVLRPQSFLLIVVNYSIKFTIPVIFY